MILKQEWDSLTELIDNTYQDILNIQDNHNVHAINIKRNLKRLRKESNFSIKSEPSKHGAFN